MSEQDITLAYFQHLRPKIENLTISGYYKYIFNMKFTTCVDGVVYQCQGNVGGDGSEIYRFDPLESDWDDFHYFDCDPAPVIPDKLRNELVEKIKRKTLSDSE